MNELNDDQLLRYARNILLPQVDVQGQERLLRMHVAVVGAGGLGAPVLQYLAAAGVGMLTVIDDDVVDDTNLQRQVIYNTHMVGASKVDSAAEVIRALNPDVEVVCKPERLTKDTADALLNGADLVIIGTDNFASRYAVNAWCSKKHVPLVSGAAIGTSGQLTSFRFADPSEPCFRCVYEQGQDEALTCATAGVLGPVVGTIGSMMALEALKLLLDFGDPLVGRLMVWDAAAMQWQTFSYQQNTACPVCHEQETTE